MNRWIASAVLIAALLTLGGGLAAWKYSSIRDANAASENQPEPIESVTVAVAQERTHRPTVTAIGTVLALRSVTLRNELAGTVRHVSLKPGDIVEAGSVLVALDVGVEHADLKAQQAQAVLAQTTLDRLTRLGEFKAISQLEIDRARAERDVTLAQIARTQAIIERKMIRVPFRARVGIADVHPGQYLNEGTVLTTLQSVEDALHVDFAVPQAVAAGLRKGDSIEVFASGEASSLVAKVAALDARVDPSTRNSMVRARIERAANTLTPGSSVRVSVAVGAPRSAVAVPASAVRKGPEGDHVFVLAPDKEGKTRAQQRSVQIGAMHGNEVLVLEGVSAGEQVAASGSFKLGDAMLVAIANGGGVQASQVVGGTAAR